MARSRVAPWLVAVVLAAAASVTARAQLVDDGQTNVLDGVVVNGLDEVTIGTNAPFTALVLTNAAMVTNSGNVYVGYHVASQSNRLTLVGAGTVWNSFYALHVGTFSAFNEFDLFDGALMINYDGYLGESSVSTNNLAVISDPGSTWSVRTFMIISGAGNRLVVTNGGSLLDNLAWIGLYVSASNSIATVVGTNSLWSTKTALQVGYYSSFNELDVLNGAAVEAQDGYIGYQSFVSNNTVLVSAASWNNATTHIGYNGAGNRLIITNGGKVVNNSSYVGENTSPTNILASSNNTVVVTGAGSSWTSTTLYLGYRGPYNQLIITNGGIVVNSINGYLGYNPSSGSNTVFLADTGSLWQVANSLNIGAASQGNQVVVSNGATVTAHDIFIPGALNTLTIVGGGVIVTGAVNVTSGNVVLNSGLLNTSSLLLSPGSPSQFTFNGGTLQVRSTSAGAAPFNVGNGSGSAVLELLSSGTNTFPGGLILSSNAMLKGLGKIVGNITNQNGGSISPGSSIGQISLKGNLVFGPGSTNFMELNANNGASDAIIGMTNVNYGGTLVLSNLSGVLANGNFFTLYSASNYSGAFDAVLPHSPGPGLRWNLDQLPVNGVLWVVTKTPSPPPLISGTSLSTGNLVITGGNGVPYDPCVLWSSTNLAAGASAWIPWTTNYFDGFGNINFNYPILPGEPGRYFRLQVE